MKYIFSRLLRSKNRNGAMCFYPKRRYNKIWIYRITCDSFSFNTRCDYVIRSDYVFILLQLHIFSMFSICLWIVSLLLTHYYRCTLWSSLKKQNILVSVLIVLQIFCFIWILFHLYHKSSLERIESNLTNCINYNRVQNILRIY